MKGVTVDDNCNFKKNYMVGTTFYQSYLSNVTFENEEIMTTGAINSLIVKLKIKIKSRL